VRGCNALKEITIDPESSLSSTGVREEDRAYVIYGVCPVPREGKEKKLPAAEREKFHSSRLSKSKARIVD
jgi:hypothetical protein